MLIHSTRQQKKIRKEFDFEVSIDETEEPTSICAHFFIANELKKKNIPLTSLAPRFIGEFQKGIDYIGSVHTFKQNFAAHVKIAKLFSYKLSIHSGSDKFSIFPTVAQAKNIAIHLKTSGTTWLECLRFIAKARP